MKVHTNPVFCAFEGCDRKFGTNSQMRAHMIRHTDDKPFQCDFPGCEYRCYLSYEVGSRPSGYNTYITGIC